MAFFSSCHFAPQSRSFCRFAASDFAPPAFSVAASGFAIFSDFCAVAAGAADCALSAMGVAKASETAKTAQARELGGNFEVAEVIVDVSMVDYNTGRTF